MHKILHSNCLFCGSKNPWSFGIEFQTNNDGSVYSTFQGHEKLQGYNGILHGGVTSALLDAAMTNCLFQQDIHAVTAELKVRFLQPILCNVELELTASIVLNKPPLYNMVAEITYNNRLMAKAQAKFMNYTTESQINITGGEA